MTEVLAEILRAAAVIALLILTVVGATAVAAFLASRNGPEPLPVRDDHPEDRGS